jgi:hypothetical protein
MKAVRQMLLLLPLAGALACAGPKDQKPEEQADSSVRVKQEDYKKRQAKFADSVLNAASSAREIASKLGKGYEVGSDRMRDTVAMLAERSDCFTQGINIDPYLAGTVSVFVHISVVGSDVIMVQQAQWTSDAGNIVTACLNEKMRSWKLNGTFGRPASYIVQTQFREKAELRPDSTAKKP